MIRPIPFDVTPTPTWITEEMALAWAPGVLGYLSSDAPALRAIRVLVPQVGGASWFPWLVVVGTPDGPVPVLITGSHDGQKLVPGFGREEALQLMGYGPTARRVNPSPLADLNAVELFDLIHRTAEAQGLALAGWMLTKRHLLLPLLQTLIQEAAPRPTARDRAQALGLQVVRGVEVVSVPPRPRASVPPASPPHLTRGSSEDAFETGGLGGAIGFITDPRSRDIMTAPGGPGVVPMIDLSMDYAEGPGWGEPDNVQFRSAEDAVRFLNWYNDVRARDKSAIGYWKVVFTSKFADGSTWRVRFDVDGKHQLRDFFHDNQGGGVTWENTTSPRKVYQSDAVFPDVPAWSPTAKAVQGAAALDRAAQALADVGMEFGKVYVLPQSVMPDDTVRPRQYVQPVDVQNGKLRYFYQGPGGPPSEQRAISLATIRELFAGAQLHQTVDRQGYTRSEMPQTPEAFPLRKFSDDRAVQNRVLKKVLETAVPSVKFATRAQAGTAWGWTDVEVGPAPGKEEVLQSLGRAMGLHLRPGQSSSQERHLIRIPAVYADLAQHIADGNAARARTAISRAPLWRTEPHAMAPVLQAVSSPSPAPVVLDVSAEVEAEAVAEDPALEVVDDSKADLVLHFSPGDGIVLRGDTKPYAEAIKGLKALGEGYYFKWSPTIKAWYRPKSRNAPAPDIDLARVAQALADAGATVALDVQEGQAAPAALAPIAPVVSGPVYFVVLGHKTSDIRDTSLAPTRIIEGAAGVEVDSLAQASEALTRFWDNTGMGMSAMVRGFGSVVNPAGEVIAVASFNGSADHVRWRVPFGETVTLAGAVTRQELEMPIAEFDRLTRNGAPAVPAALPAPVSGGRLSTDLNHLHSLEDRLSRERERLSVAKTQSERDLREVWINQIKREIGEERKILALPDQQEVALDDDALLAALSPEPAAPVAPPELPDHEHGDDYWTIPQKRAQIVDLVRQAQALGQPYSAPASNRMVRELIGTHELVLSPTGHLQVGQPEPTWAHPSEVAQAAKGAFEGTSQFPEQRAISATRGYASTFNGWAQKMLALGTEEDRGWLEEQISEAKTRYRAAFSAYLHAHARTTSWLVTGPAGRNERREGKKHDTADRRLQEAGEVLGNAETRIRRELHKRSVDRQGGEAAIAARKAEALLAHGRVSATEARQVAERAAELAVRETEAAQETQSWEFPAAERPLGYAQGLAGSSRGAFPVPAGTAEYDYGDDRLRLRFEERTSSEVSYALKHSGWKWSPSNAAWQRQLTDNAVRSAREFTGLPLPYLAERQQARQAASEAAAQAVQAARTERKGAARAGEGTFGDVLDAEMRRGARWKLPAPSGKVISPSVSRTSKGWMLTYRTGETGKSPFGGGGTREFTRHWVVGLVVRHGLAYLSLYPNQNYPGENVAQSREIPLQSPPAASDVPAVLEAVGDMLTAQGLEGAYGGPRGNPDPWGAE